MRVERDSSPTKGVLYQQVIELNHVDAYERKEEFLHHHIY